MVNLWERFNMSGILQSLFANMRSFGVATAEGQLWAWGGNTDGRLGDNSTTNRSSPVQIGSDEDWVKGASGVYHVLQPNSEGELYSWGRGTTYSTGQGSNSHLSNPTQIGSLTTWGKVAAGQYSSASIKTDGTLWTWGANANGQLGLGNTTTPITSPVQVGSLTNWASISMGGQNMHVINEDGELFGCGNGTAIGNGGDTGLSSLVQIGSLTNWAQTSNGGTATQSCCIAVKTDNTLWSWGFNPVGQLGTGNTTTRTSPVQIGSLTTWLKVAAANSFAFAIKTDGTLWSWGLNDNGALGDGTYTNRSSPVQIGSLTTWTEVAGHAFTGQAIEDGKMYMWGYGGLGENAQGSSKGIQLNPIQVGSLTTWKTCNQGPNSQIIHGIKSS